MKHEAIKALYDIIKISDWSSFCPEKNREEQLDKWVKAWIIDVEFTQSVVNSKYLTSEYNDIIKYKLSQSLAEELAETCTTFNIADKQISAKMCAFRRKEK